MKCAFPSSVVVLLSALLASSPADAAPTRPSPPPSPAAGDIAGLPFRNIGPAIMGGRVDDFAVVESRPSTPGCLQAMSFVASSREMTFFSTSRALSHGRQPARGSDAGCRRASFELG